MNRHPNTECAACQRVRDCLVIGDRMLCGECAERDANEAAGRDGDRADWWKDERRESQPHRAEGGR